MTLNDPWPGFYFVRFNIFISSPADNSFSLLKLQCIVIYRWRAVPRRYLSLFVIILLLSSSSIIIILFSSQNILVLVLKKTN